MPKKKVKKKITPKASAFYVISGGSISHSKRTCPKCGSGVFMAEHKTRLTCGKCHYTEFKGKKG